MALVEFDPEGLPPEITNALATGILVEGAPLIDWWRRQSAKLQQDIMDQVRQSLENGEGIQKATTRIVGGTVDGTVVPGVMKKARRQAETIVRTAINEVVTQARIQTMQGMTDVAKALQQISTLDSRTSDICIAYSGKVWDLETLEPIGHDLAFNDGPPRHFNCRSSVVPVLKSWEELGIDAKDIPLGDRASMDGSVPGDITFSDWLKKKGKTFQDDILGPGRARLWREGKITLTQLVDFRGNPLSLEQLEAIVSR